jgi:hypothetical protein
MTQEQAEQKLNAEPPLQYAIRGMKVSDGSFYLDAALCYSRDDVRAESEKFTKFVIYDLSKSKNQNL